MRFLRLLAVVLALTGVARPGAAQDFGLPGLSAEASRYAAGLARRFPAGGTPQQRAAAEARAAQAEGRGDAAAAAAAWEERLGMGAARPEMWLSLARAQMARVPPDPARALFAARRNFDSVEAGAAEVPSLRLMADALRAQERWALAIGVLEAVAERLPGDAGARAALAEGRRAAGMLLRAVRTEPEAEPARACLSFTVAPQAGGRWQPEDWVRAEPPLPGLAVTREADGLCVAGLPWGRRTRLVLRAGLPGEDGANLRADLPVEVSMPDRASRIAFEGGGFLLPRGAAPRVTVATTNVERLALRLVRVSERNLVPLTRDFRLGQSMAGYLAEELPETRGRVVWEGKRGGAGLPAQRDAAGGAAAARRADAVPGRGSSCSSRATRRRGGGARRRRCR